MESNITKSNVEKILTVLNNQETGYTSKKPNTLLTIKDSPIGHVRAITKGYDDKFYLIRANGSFEKHECAVNESDPLETSSWDIDNNGTPNHMLALQEGFTITTNVGTEPNRRARIYHMETMQDTPQLVYESPTGQDTFIADGFGVKSYFNGINSMVLIGMYGRGPAYRDLLLSVDGGKSYRVIKKTKNNNPDFNSHWHDVAFDVYSGFIWASEGDSSLNRGIHFSDDLGETWYTLAEGEAQPTAIIPFPDHVIFGSDTGFVGLRNFEKPQLVDNYNVFKDSVKPFKQFKPSREAYEYYADSPISSGAEAYIKFNISGGGMDGYHQPDMIMGTGDFGRSWYFVAMGYQKGPDQNHMAVRQLWGMDDKYIYGTRSTDGTNLGRQVFFAEKPEWV